jgi:hypothetical protein
MVAYNVKFTPIFFKSKSIYDALDILKTELENANPKSNKQLIAILHTAKYFDTGMKFLYTWQKHIILLKRNTPSPFWI